MALSEMSDELGYATRLLESFVAEHFPHNPDWKPQTDMIGVLMQLDNASVIARDYKARIEALEAALRQIANPSTVAGMHEQDRARKLQGIASAALAQEQDK
jgi:hypothetical protein